jgi:hypothetical protein
VVNKGFIQPSFSQTLLKSKEHTLSQISKKFVEDREHVDKNVKIVINNTNFTRSVSLTNIKRDDSQLGDSLPSRVPYHLQGKPCS